MRRVRFTIAGLGGLVLLAALGLAALRNASAWWAAAVESAALVLLGVSAVGAWRGGRAWRAFWAGAFVLGGGYGALAFLIPTPEPRGTKASTFAGQGAPEAELDAPGPRFLVDALLDRLVPAIYPPETLYTVSYRGQKIMTIRGDAALARAYGPRLEREAAEGTGPRATLYIGPRGELVDVRPNSKFGGNSGVAATFLYPIDLTDYDPDALVVTTAVDPAPTPSYRAAFLRAGHALFAILAGLLGGIAAALAFGPRADRAGPRRAP